MNHSTSRPSATAHDVARLAGVSQSAVSRAFTSGASISPEMRRKVVAAAATLGYRPNLLARSLITKRSNIVGVAVGDLSNPFYPALLDALSARLTASGLHVLLFTAEIDAEVDKQIEEILLYQIEAMLLLSTRMSSQLASYCHDAAIPVVLVNRTAALAESMCSVTGENLRGGGEIGRFLLENGNRDLAFMAGLEDSSNSRDREQGFMDYLSSQGAPAPLREVGHFTREGAAEATRKLLSRRRRPDAIFCANDHMACVAMEVARSEFGLNVGKDLAIVGFDDTPMAAWPSFSLTTFSQPVAALAERAVQFILNFSQIPDSGRHETVPGELIIRNSAPSRA